MLMQINSFLQFGQSAKVAENFLSPLHSKNVVYVIVKR